MQPNPEQQVFMLFFAIIWGAVANVQPRWKAFQWPLIFRHKPAFKRVALSVLLLNLVPLALFAYALWALNGPEAQARPIAHLIGHGIIPAFALFGCYRLWLATVEAWPAAFYSATSADVPEKYRHAEPSYRTKHDDRSDSTLPIVELGPDTACPNFVTALAYLALGIATPWIGR